MGMMSYAMNGGKNWADWVLEEVSRRKGARRVILRPVKSRKKGREWGLTADRFWIWFGHDAVGRFVASHQGCL